MKLLHGDSLEILKRATSNSVDAIVTDPPYGLSFMNKHWDYDVPSVELWTECMRVLKSGGHLLSFAGSRTYHRMAVNIEDAGFEIRDQIMWVYGSGFPKSHNIGKAVDKKLGNEREYIGKNPDARPNSEHTNKILSGAVSHPDITKGNSQWEGWGTALKPAHEPIVVARKPFKGTVVDSVLEHGTGGINIDASRVGAGEEIASHKMTSGGHKQTTGVFNETYTEGDSGKYTQVQGRFPANFIHDGSDEVVDKLGEPARFFYTAKASKAERNKGLEGMPNASQGTKTSKERNFSDDFKEFGDGKQSGHKNLQPQKNHHPTVKPIALMRYLVRLVTPKGGTVLDPFMGSGTTGIACKNEGFDFIGIEREEEYVEIAKARITN